MPKKTSIFLIAIVLVLLTGTFSYWFFRTGDSELSNKSQEIATPSLTSVESSEADLPDNFPIFPDAEITDSWSSDTQETRGSSFVLRTEESKDDLFEFYRSELIEFGWTIQNENNENFVMNIRSENIQGFLILSDAETGETLISITFAQIKDE